MFTIAIRYLPFDSTAGDRSITSADFSELLESVSGDGYVANEGGQMAVVESVPPALNVRVSTGAAWVRGRFLQVYNVPETLVIPTADPANPRIDRVVIRRDLADRRMELAIKTGIPSPATNVAPPDLQRDDTIWEISIAQVYVGAGVVAIYNANITDERDNPAVCGLSTHPSLGGANFIPDVADSVGEGHINWGTGADQVSAVDIPISDTGLNYTATNVEAALAEEADARQAHEAARNNPHAVTAAQAGAIATSGGDATGPIQFNNNVGPKCRNTVGTLYDLIKINNYNNLQVGDGGRPLVLLSSAVPSYYDGVAFHDLWHKGNLNPANLGTLSARIGRSTSQSVSSGSKANISWNTAQHQEGGTFWTTAAADRITIPATGVYLVVFNAYFGSGSGADINIWLNGNTGQKISKLTLDSSIEMFAHVPFVYKFNSGDFFIVELDNNGGETCTMNFESYYSPFLSITKV